MIVYDLFATVWQVPTLSRMSEGLATKKLNFTAAVDLAYNAMRAARARMSAKNPVYLFVAPEYYWVKGANLAHFNATEKDDVFDYLRQLSTARDNLVIVPGTVQWSVPKGDYGGNTAKQSVLNLAATKNVAFNTTPVYLNGERVLTYFKKFNDGFVEGGSYSRTTEAAYGAGPADQAQTFDAHGLRFGVEVCGDFNDGKLNLSLAGEKVDVMVLTAATMGHDFAGGLSKVPVRHGGAFVHCDARDTGDARGMDKNGLWVVTPGSGWHGSPDGVAYYDFVDLDNHRRVIGIHQKPASAVNLTVKAMQGFGATQTLPAAGVTINPNGFLTDFSVVISGKKDYRTQTATFTYIPSNNTCTVTLTRALSATKTRTVTVTKDAVGKIVTSEGNVSKIGALVPAPGPNLYSYYLPIPEA